MDLGSTVMETFGCNCQYHYQDIDYIARGAFGIVYKAKMTILGNCTHCTEEDVAAVKVVQFPWGVEVLGSPKSWDTMRQRWKNLLELKHSHLAAYRQVAITTLFGAVSVRFLMDYYDGHDLSKLMQQARMNGSSMGDQSAVICYSIQMADGLQFLHQHGIIHGNLKPEHVLVKQSQSGHHTLLIGLEQMHGSVSTIDDMDMIRGTVRYMSPEMLKKFVFDVEVVVGRKTDIWSLGCIILDLASYHAGIEARWMYNPATGERYAVQSCTSAFQFCSKMIDGFEPLVDDMLPEFLSTNIRNCLQPDSEDRMSAEELREKFRAKAEVLVQNEARGHPRCPCGKYQLVKMAASITVPNNALFYLKMLVLAGLVFFLLLLILIFVCP